MSKFQALFVLWLRHKNFQACSWRELASLYEERYRTMPNNRFFFMKGNQLDGIYLEEEAFKILVPDSLFKEPIDLFEIDLSRIFPSFNLKRHR